MTINSRSKGARAELAFSHFLKEQFGLDARRACQYSGKGNTSDILCDIGCHFEVKHVEKLNIEKAMAQAVRDNADKKIPVVAHRRNRGEWLITIHAKDIKRFAEEFLKR